jgi:hypothetical protein
VTPAHPEYPAAHGVASGSVAEILRRFFGTKKITISFTPVVPGYTGGQITHDSTDDMIKQVIEGRILGGMHYRTSVRHGAIMGRKVAHWLTHHYFQPIGTGHGSGAELGEVKFIRGDSNADGAVDLSDGIHTLGYLFSGTGGPPACLKAFDANDDGQVDISDALYTLRFLVLHEVQPPAPFRRCDLETTESELPCASHPPCG